MKHTKGQWIVSGTMIFIAIVLVVTGIIGFSIRGGGFVNETMNGMRTYAVMRTAAGGLINQIALEAKKQARAYADENKFSRNAKAEYASQAEAAARAQAEQDFAQFEGVNTAKIDERIAALEAAQRAFAEQDAAERDAYAQKLLNAQPSDDLTQEIEGMLESDEGEAEGEIIDEADLEEITEEKKIDYSGFKASASLLALQEAIAPQFDLVWAELTVLLPGLTEDMKGDLQKPILAVVYTYASDFEAQYDRYAAMDAEKGFSSADQWKMMIARRGDDMFTIGIGLVMFALTVFFYKKLVSVLGIPRLVILLFFVLLCVLAGLYGINVSTMIGNVLKRTGMFGVLALAMLPGIQSGISLNMGMTVGIICGLLSTLIAMENNMTGWNAFIFAVGLGSAFAVPVGWLYSKLLNRLKGNEMTVSTYVGFSFVSLMSIFWMILPFHNAKLTWALGSGLRVMHNMSGSFGSILNNLWSFKLFGATVPTGLLLFFLLCCFLMWLFSRSKTGTALIAAGSNPRFAEAAGIHVDRMRTIGTIISTVIAAVGIIVYSQSFGFMQLYSGPRQMGFIAASAILIGGASVTKAKVSHVILGTFLFQGVLALGIQVANAAISEGGLSEVMRILISNGIILYALTQSGGESRA